MNPKVFFETNWDTKETPKPQEPAEPEHRPIDEVKWLRARYNLGLKEAKDLYDGRARKIWNTFVGKMDKSWGSFEPFRDEARASRAVHELFERLPGWLGSPTVPELNRTSDEHESSFLETRYGVSPDVARRISTSARGSRFAACDRITAEMQSLVLAQRETKSVNMRLVEFDALTNKMRRLIS